MATPLLPARSAAPRVPPRQSAMSRRLHSWAQLWSTPGWRRHQATRRLLALVVLSFAFYTSFISAEEDTVSIPVFNQELHAGSVIQESHLQERHYPRSVLPTQVLDDPEQLIGQTLVSGVYPGQYATDIMVLSPRLGEGPNDTLVPLRLADPDVARLLRHGDQVSVVAADPQSDSAAARVIARGGRVILSNAEPGTILLALDEEAAQAVAAASLRGPLSVILGNKD